MHAVRTLRLVLTKFHKEDNKPTLDSETELMSIYELVVRGK